jgi:hypothetical protein
MQFVRDIFSRYPLLHRAVLLLITFFCFHAAFLELRATRQFQQAEKWPSAQAQIKASFAYSTGYSWSVKRNRYCPMLRYTYRAGGRTYEAYNSVFDFVCWPDGNDFVAHHPAGTFIKIAYDPTDPAVSIVPDAVRDPGYPWGDTIGGIILALALLVDLFSGRTSERAPDALDSELRA